VVVVVPVDDVAEDIVLVAYVWQELPLQFEVVLVADEVVVIAELVVVEDVVEEDVVTIVLVVVALV